MMRYPNNMKTLLDINKNILIDYQDFDNVNENWNIGSYLNTFYDINSAIAFAKLYFPDFIEEKNCVILSLRYDKGIFEQWHKESKGNVSEIEKMCNLYELKDFFHINPIEFNSEEEYQKVIDVLGEVLKKSWDINLKLLYPNNQFKVVIFEEYESKFITFYSL